MIKTSAPGKLLLLGDYAVVYGHPCIVTAVDKRLYVEAKIIEAQEDVINTPQVKESRFVLETIAYMKEQFNLSASIQINTKGDFSHQVGLGSSSAVTVATVEALNQLFKLHLTKKDIFTISYKVNLLIQGVGSGFDIAAATYGKTIRYIKGGEELTELSLKSLPLVVGYSGIKADTPYYIRKVAEAFKQRQSELNELFTSMHSLVDEATIALQKSDFQTVGNCFNNGHTILQKLGVSIPKLDSMVKVARNAGAWGAKLSGAGGGDCMIALVPPDKTQKVKDAIERVGGEIITVGLQANGVS
ncbi:MAG: mevalonate kinase [Microgenomates group bacterium]